MLRPYQLALIIFIFVVGCAPKRVEVAAPTWRGDGWVAVEQSSGEVLIVASSEAAAERGVKEFCANKKTVCTVDRGAARFIRQREK